jgi:hypothetical protein
MNQYIEKMTPGTAEILYRDIEEWGAVAMVVARSQLVAAGLPRKRAERLRAWVLAHGSADPRPRTKLAQTAPVNPSTGRTHLIIGDCHAAPGQSLERFRLLGKLIRHIKPDLVVSIGDWYSMDSLCQHRSVGERADESTKSDIVAGEMALALLETELSGFEGQKVITLGNHDERLHSMAVDAPWLEGLHNVGRAHEQRGWKVVPFMEPFRSDGILYQHYLTVRGGRRAISGKFHSLRLLERVMFSESVVVGHSHRLCFRSEARPGRRVNGLVAGCYFDHVEDYAGEDNGEWWRGICVLRNVRNGDYDLETWSMDRIVATFG